MVIAPGHQVGKQSEVQVEAQKVDFEVGQQMLVDSTAGAL